MFDRLLLAVLAFAPLQSCAAAPRAGAWSTDPIWYDGQSEMATYRAVRTIEGRAREYVAVAYTDKERYDARTTTKSATDAGREVFKHHWSEIVPTEAYPYRFSTSVYAAADSLEALKLTASTQEDCGASFKQVWREGDALRWFDSVYLPDAGNREGRLERAKSVHFVDELPLYLRDFPFGRESQRALRLVRSQKDTGQVPFEPFAARATYVGKEVRILPIGALEAHHVRVEGADFAADYWFAADGAAPRLHVLVELADGSGTRYQLESLTRTAYWKR